MKKKFEIGQKVVWICDEPYSYKEVNAKIISQKDGEYIAFTQDNKDMADNGLYLVIDDDTEEYFYVPLVDSIFDFFESDEGYRISEIESGKTFELEKTTPAGEDWIFCIPYCRNFTELTISLHDAYKNFDVDEEAELLIANRGKNGIPESISTILEDQLWKKRNLELLYWHAMQSMQEKGELHA